MYPPFTLQMNYLRVKLTYNTVHDTYIMLRTVKFCIFFVPACLQLPSYPFDL
jgi:hypothetical protein